MKLFSPHTQTFINFLFNRHKYLYERSMLNEDGSFSCSDRYIASEINCATPTITALKKYLYKLGFIEYETISYKKRPTKYWILKKLESIAHGNKRCIRCFKIKNLEDFTKKGAGRRRAECKDCYKIIGVSIRNMVLNGKISKPTTCSMCFQEFPLHKIHGHHFDYNKPLEVIWLCFKCHRKVHSGY